MPLWQKRGMSAAYEPLSRRVKNAGLVRGRRTAEFLGGLVVDLGIQDSEDEDAEEEEFDGPHQNIRFHVKFKLREILMISIRNALFNILTLTLYRFWARTRVRRYLWSRISFLDDSLEYTGKSLELFSGFALILLILVLPLVGISVWMQLFVSPDSPLTIPYGIAIYVGLVFLYGVAKYRTQRYRLSRTLWRGIRMGLKGSWVSYGLRMLVLFYMTLVTLMWSYPLQRVLLFKQMMGHTTFGDQQFRFDGEASPLYTSYAIAWLASLVGLIAGYSTANMVFRDAFGIDLMLSSGNFRALISNLSSDQFASILIATVSFYAVGGIVLAITTAWYRANEYRYFAEHTKLNGLTFRFDVTGFAMLRLKLGNAIITIATLGLGLPWVQMRNFRFLFKRLKAEGPMDIESICQGDSPVPWVGEGLAEFFDIGAV